MLNSEYKEITPSHLKRNAYLYVRQSSMRQVYEHAESTKRQYALADRAIALGWSADKVITIDSDLGQSGAKVTNRDGFKKLVAEGGDVDKGNAIIGVTPIRAASLLGYKDVVLFLLEKGADTEVTDKSGLTALHSAVFHGKLDIANMLIQHNANLNAQDQHGRTVLMEAASRGLVDVAKLLLEKGARVSTQDQHGQTAATIATQRRDVNMTALLEKIYVGKKDNPIDVKSFPGARPMNEYRGAKAHCIYG